MTLLSRRSLLVAGAAGLVAALAAPAMALSVTTYTPDVLAAAQASGKPFLIDFYATWCTTCRAQERVIEGLMEENPDYRAIPVIRVDWDEHEGGELVRSMGIPRRSTLVVMQGNRRAWPAGRGNWQGPDPRSARFAI